MYGKLLIGGILHFFPGTLRLCGSGGGAKFGTDPVVWICGSGGGDKFGTDPVAWTDRLGSGALGVGCNDPAYQSIGIFQDNRKSGKPQRVIQRKGALHWNSGKRNTKTCFVASTAITRQFRQFFMITWNNHHTSNNGNGGGAVVIV